MLNAGRNLDPVKLDRVQMWLPTLNQFGSSYASPVTARCPGRRSAVSQSARISFRRCAGPFMLRFLGRLLSPRVDSVLMQASEKPQHNQTFGRHFDPMSECNLATLLGQSTVRSSTNHLPAPPSPTTTKSQLDGCALLPRPNEDPMRSLTRRRGNVRALRRD